MMIFIVDFCYLYQLLLINKCNPNKFSSHYNIEMSWNGFI